MTSHIATLFSLVILPVFINIEAVNYLLILQLCVLLCLLLNYHRFCLGNGSRCAHAHLLGCDECISLVLTFNLADSKQEELAKAKLMCLGLTGVNGCEGLTVCSIVSVWDPLDEDPEGCIIKKESVVTECLWSVLFFFFFNTTCGACRSEVLSMHL